MALNTRDLWIILRARDEASRVLRSFNSSLRDLDNESEALARKQVARGQSLMMVGGVIAGAGVIAINVLNDMTNAAMEYSTQAAKAFTQTDNVATSVAELKEIGRDVAREIPSAFSGMQEGLYDIFSSMDVNVDEAKMLLREFARASVAGQVELQTAARGTIAILNAYGMEAKDVTRVNDVMFQLVRKGVGTYEEFSKSIGRAIPAAVRANQSFETLGGMMAFLTRNGLSTSMAATSAARALEAMVNPKTVTRLEEMGVNAKDANGEFLPMVDILSQLNDRFATMTSPERAAALQDLFKGSGGTIQARRFFDTVFANFDEFEQRVSEMQAAAGALDEAYEVMFDAPQVQMQLMTNKYEIMRTEIGDKLIPIKLKLVEVISSLLDKWNALSPTMQSVITYTAAITSGLLVLGGVITMISGGLLIMGARFAGVGGMMSKVAPVVGRVGGALATFGGYALGVTAVAIGVGMMVDEFTNGAVVPNANALKKAIQELADTGDMTKLNENFDNFGTFLGMSRSSVTDLGDALNQAFNRDLTDNIASFFGKIPGITAYTELAEERFRNLDKAFADMISSGNVEAAEAGFAQVALQAKELGIPMEDLVTLFPQYADAMEGVDLATEAAASTIQQYPALLDDVTESTEDQLKAIQEWLDMVAEQDAAFITLDGAWSNLTEKNKAFAQATADATDSSEDSWEDYIGKFPNTVAGYLEELQKMVDAQNNWETNMITLSGRVSQTTLDELARLGPEGAPLVAELVNASDEELSRMDDLYSQRSSEATQAFADTLAKAGPVLAQIGAKNGQDVARDLAGKLAAGTTTVEQIMAQYGITISNMKPTITLKSDTSQVYAAVDKVIRDNNGRSITLDVLGRTVSVSTGVNNMIARARGGLVWGEGTSTSDSIAAWLSKGEYVVRAAAVERYGLGFLNALNAERFASGGLVGGTPFHEATPVVHEGGGTPAAMDNSRTVNFYPGAIVTQEIDPRIHSEDLGFMIAERVG